MKRTIAVLFLVFALMLAGCEQAPAQTSIPPETTVPVQTTAPTETTVPETTEPVQTAAPTEPVEYQFPEGASLRIWNEWPHSWSKVEGFIQEASGVTVEWKSWEYTGLNCTGMVSAPEIDYDIKYTAFAREDAKLGAEGLYVNLMDYREQMPNFFARFEAEENARYREAFLSEGNALYVAPVFAIEEECYPAWIYREDIFRERELQVPTDWGTLYSTLKALKAVNPDKYPFALSAKAGNYRYLTGFQDFARQFGVDFCPKGFAVNTAGEYYEPVVTDAMRQMLQKLRLLLEEGLLDPGFMDYDGLAIYEQFLAGDILITYDTTSLVRLLCDAGVEDSSDYSIAWFQNIPLAQSELPYAARKAQLGDYGWAVVQESCEDITLAVRFIDWLYSEEGIIAANWGIEGESFDVDEAGNKYFLESFVKHRGDLGEYFSQFRLCGVRDRDAAFALYPQKLKAIIYDTVAAVEAGGSLPTPQPEFQGILSATVTSWEYPYTESRDAWIREFLVGWRDIHNDAHWQEMKDALAGKGGAELLSIYNAAKQKAE